MTADAIFALAALVAGFGTLVFAVLGWLTPMPDGSARFRCRLWSWVCAAAFAYLSFASVHHPRWWAWLAIIAAGSYCINRIRHWWRAVEHARALEKAQPWKRVA